MPPKGVRKSLRKTVHDAATMTSSRLFARQAPISQGQKTDPIQNRFLRPHYKRVVPPAPPRELARGGLDETGGLEAPLNCAFLSKRVLQRLHLHRLQGRAVTHISSAAPLEKRFSGILHRLGKSLKFNFVQVCTARFGDVRR